MKGTKKANVFKANNETIYDNVNINFNANEAEFDETNLYDYQKRAINEIVERKNLGLWIDMGLGKTIVSLVSIKRLLDRKEIKRALVVAPKTVAENVWHKERNRWKNVHSLRISLVIGDVNERLNALKNEADIYVISRDNIGWLSKLKVNSRINQAGYLNEMDALFIDESTSFKNRSTIRWRSLCQKGNRNEPLVNQFNVKVLLSGTPASESYIGLFSQIYILDGGKRLGTSITKFKERFMIPELIKNHFIYRKFKTGAIRYIDEQIKDICIAMKTEDYLELPPKIDVIQYTGYKADTIYNKMRFDGVITVNNNGINETIISPDAAGRYNKLRQISSGFIYTEYGEAVPLHNKKIETLKEILETIDSNVLIYFQYEYEKQLLMQLGGITIETPELQDKWNNKEIKIAIANPLSLGYGANIQYGGNTIIWYSLPLSCEQFLQANKRIHRNGQRAKFVRMIYLISEKTVEESIYKLLKEQKTQLLQALMDFHSIGNNNNSNNNNSNNNNNNNNNAGNVSDNIK